MRLSWLDHVRIWIAYRVVIPQRVWRAMCDLGFCPAGIHKFREARRLRERVAALEAAAVRKYLLGWNDEDWCFECRLCDGGTLTNASRESLVHEQSCPLYSAALAGQEPAGEAS